MNRKLKLVASLFLFTLIGILLAVSVKGVQYPEHFYLVTATFVSYLVALVVCIIKLGGQK